MTSSIDWRSETQVRLASSLLYQKLRQYCDASDSHVIALVDDMVYYSYQRTKSTIRHMGEFTLHDGDHLFNVLQMMERLLTPALIDKLSAPEIQLLILTAFFHDIGMAPAESDVVIWKKIWDRVPDVLADEDAEFRLFERYYIAHPDQKREIESQIEAGNSTHAELLKGYVIADYIRQTHAQRAKAIIAENWNGKIKFRDMDMTVDFAELCFSHNEDPLALLKLDRSSLCAPGIFACLPFIGVILRLADVLDFDAKRTPDVLFSHLWVRHPISLKEWNKHRSVQAWHIESRNIQFHAKCNHPAIEAAIHDFCDIIDGELGACSNIISEILKDVPRLGDASNMLPLRIDRARIETQRDITRRPIYTYRRTQFNLSRKQVIDLLMGTKLYGSPEVALRELLQNSIDACLLRKSMEVSWGNSYAPEITVTYKTENGRDVLTVEDNGTGMDQDIIDNYYSKVGVSFYKSSDFYNLKAQTNADFTPTSRFGIGILSCFMVADSIEVDTRKVYGPHESSTPTHIVIEGQESIFYIKDGLRSTPGTVTKLHLRQKDNPWDRMSEDAFISSVEKTVPNPPFKIVIKTDSHEKIKDETSFLTLRLSLSLHNWRPQPNIRIIEIVLRDPNQGITGSVKVGILEKKSTPVAEITFPSKTITIESTGYDLKKTMRMKENEIELTGTSISVDDDGDVDTSPSHSRLLQSAGTISLHGIQVPVDLFPEMWRRQRNQAYINWPIPIAVTLDVGKNMDLDLNSARTQILPGARWDRFEEQLSYLVFSKLIEKAKGRYSSALFSVLISKTDNNPFQTGLKRAFETSLLLDRKSNRAKRLGGGGPS